ncbi:MAG: chromosomal replication initiator protein DnaA [Muribaculaceae bacterium]|nr:chromosomal replication initiator protein DnaA [Muribaculaceae bacterium]MDE6575443.1 chromosomal replication initiator protein DnaA [Muribaculaceae bacterium]
MKDNLLLEQYNTWFRDITSESFVENRLILVVPSDFFKEQLEERHLPLLRAGVRKVYGEGIQIMFRCLTIYNDPSSATLQRSSNPSTTILAQSKAEPANPFKQPGKQDFDPQLNPRYTFENYCQSTSNQIARSIGEAIANNPSLKTFNPLFVFGPSGVGKTHLIQAIGIRIKERNPQARVLYVTARLFQSQYTAAISKNINSFFHFYQSIDTLIIDDIQDLQNLPGTQNTFFHIFNHLHQHDRQIIMSSDCAPSEMEGFEARLLSRFKWGMQVELERPDITLRRDVLKLKSEQDGLSIPAEVSEYIAANVTQSVRELEGIVVSLLAHATVLNREISLELARRVMLNAVKINRKQINFEMIAEAVAAHYKIAPDLLFTKTRKREVSDARQVIMYLAKTLAKMPLTAIGHKLDRSHATVIYGCNTIEDRSATDKSFAAELQAIEATINAQ